MFIIFMIFPPYMGMFIRQDLHKYLAGKSCLFKQVKFQCCDIFGILTCLLRLGKGVCKNILKSIRFMLKNFESGIEFSIFIYGNTGCRVFKQGVQI